MIGQLIGSYKVIDKLGEGGMGSVYKGIDTMLDREVAIKALRPELARQTSIVERFRKEAVTLAKLNHPNIATLYQMLRQGDELYMVLEYVGGPTLESIMMDRGAIPAEEAIPVFSQVLDGINHAHELGIVHRDVKPANMMFNEKGTLKVLDFGIARLLGSARMTRAGNIIGTLEYMSPEQVKGLETDARSDLYALGMMLYEILTGQLPFRSDNEFALMKMQTEEIPRPPRDLVPSIPEAVEAAILKAILKNPDERFQTVGEFREVLLSAGFTQPASFAGRAATPSGNFRTTSSDPPISRESLPAAAGAIKGTRLAGAVGQTPGQEELPRPTRLADTSDPGLPETATTGSFFSRLTPVHYVVAGVALLLIFGVVLAVPILFFAARSLSAGDTSPANSTNKPSAPNSQKQEITPRESTPQPRIEAAAPPPISTPDIQSSSPPVREPVPITEQSRPGVDPPRARTQKTPKPKPKTAGKKCTAEQLLTGDC